MFGSQNLTTLLLLLTLVLAYLINVHGATTGGEESISLPSGLKIPTHIVRRSLPSPLQHEPHRHVYELDSNGDILGPNAMSIKLSEKAEAPANNIVFHPAAHASLNGLPINIRQLNSTHRRHGEYSAVFSHSGTKLLAVWGPQLHLLPLQHSSYRNVFVNSFRVPSHLSGHTQSETKPETSDESGSQLTMHNISSALITSSDRSQDCAAGVIHYFEVFAAIDNTFCAIFDNDVHTVLTVLQASMDIANEPFAATCIRPVLIGLDAHCNDPNDPYPDPASGTSPTSSILGNLRTHFESTKRAVNRDTVMIFTGYGEPRAIGRAYRPGSCSRLGYGWVERVNPFTLAHEIGHNLQMWHTGTSPGSGVMGTGGLSRNEWYFAPSSIANLTQYIDHQFTSFPVDVSCITTFAPSCHSSCPNNCVNNKCVVNTRPGPGQISCVPSYQYHCNGRTIVTDNGGYFNTLVDCPSGFEFVQEPYDPNNPVLQCCNPPSDSTTASGISTQYTYISDPFTFRNVLVTDAIQLATNSTYRTLTFINTQAVACGQTTLPPSSSRTPSSTPSASAIPTATATVTTTATATATATSLPSRSPTARPSTISVPDVSPFPTTSVSTLPSNSPALPSITLPPSPSTSTRPSPRPFNPLTCSASFRNNDGPRCSRVYYRRRARIGRSKTMWVRAAVYARYGSFFIRLRGRTGTVISGVSSRVGATAFLRRVNPPAVSELTRARSGYTNQMNVQINTITKPAIVSCCSRNALSVLMRIRLCPRRVSVQFPSCAEGVLRMRLRINCQPSCPTTATSIPMGPGQRCPACTTLPGF